MPEQTILELPARPPKPRESGITAVIDHRGKIVAQSAQFEPSSLRAGLIPRTGITPYTRLGDRPLLAALLLIVVLAAIESRRRAARKE